MREQLPPERRGSRKLGLECWGWEERDSGLPQGMKGCGYKDGVTHPGESMGTGKNIS